MSVSLTFPDSTYTSANKPSVATLKSDLSAIETELNAHEADTSAHGTSGDVVGTSDNQTLTNKTLTSPTITTPIIKTWDGWQAVSDTWTYASASTITVPAGAASLYQKGDKIKLTNSTVKYFVITSVADTVLTVTGGTDYVVADAAISLVYVSKAANPQGFPHYFNYTPTLGASGSMTYGTTTVHVAKFSIIGNTLHLFVYALGTTGGSASTALTFTAPVAPAETSATEVASGCYINDNVSRGGYVYYDTDKFLASKYDTSNFGTGANRGFSASISYQI